MKNYELIYSGGADDDAPQLGHSGDYGRGPY